MKQKLLTVTSTVILAVFLAGCTTGRDKGPNTLTRAERKAGWTLLFDGTTSDGLRGYNMPDFPSDNWEVIDGTLHCLGVGKGNMTNTDIITVNKYGNFELSLEWKISEGGNSGIFFLAQEIPGMEIYQSSPEMQVLDNKNHPDTAGVGGNHQAGSLYDLIPAVPQNALPFGEWNQVKIMINQGEVVLSQNGVNVVKFTLWTDEWREMCANSKFRDWDMFVNIAKEGYIGLQDHGTEVWYRNLKIKEL